MEAKISVYATRARRDGHTTLNLPGLNLGDADAVRIHEALQGGGGSVRELNVSHNQMGHDGVGMLELLLFDGTLTMLDVSGNPGAAAAPAARLPEGAAPLLS